MKRPYLCALAALTVGLALVARSAPVRNFPQKLIQPDGSVIHCFASGDEFNHWLHDGDDYTILRDPASGFFVYALVENGRVVPSGHIVGRVDPEGARLIKGARESPEHMTRRRDVLLKGRGLAPKVAFRASALNDIVIFIRFAGESPMVFPDSISTYDVMFNSSDPGANSMYNYYREVSYGQFAVTGTFYPNATDSVLSFQDPYIRDYYRPYNTVANPSGYKSLDEAGSREQSLLQRAIESAIPHIPAGLDIDQNGDGFVDNITFIVSGDPDAWADLLWPHSGLLWPTVVMIKGKQVANFDFELRGDLLRENGGVGTLCYEMFHCLGAPDLYHYAVQGPGEVLVPVGMWDIMEGTSNPPQHMSAYMKYRYGGWIQSIPAITASGTYALSPLTSPAKNCYKIASAFSTSQFYVVEYRRRNSTFELHLPDQGVLVYRINTACIGNAAGPPDEVYIYRPHGSLASNGIITRATYSANSGRVALTDSTNPSGFLADGTRGGLHLTEVGYIGDSITFDIRFSPLAQLYVDSRAVDLRRIENTVPGRDTTFSVWNIGFATDSIEVSLGYGNISPDSAIAVSPTLLALGAGDSAGVTFSIRPPLLTPQFYSAVVRVHSRFGQGQTLFSKAMLFQIIPPTEVAESEELPTAFSLDQNYPNPFNPSTTIRYHVPISTEVRLCVYDVLGREVALLVNERTDAGTFEVTFSAGVWYTRVGEAAGLVTGFYICRLVAGSFVQTRKLLLIQ